MAPGSTQPLTGIFPGGKDGRCTGLTTLPPSCADCLEIWEPQTPGTLRACPALQWDCLPFTIKEKDMTYWILRKINLYKSFRSFVQGRHCARWQRQFAYDASQLIPISFSSIRAQDMNCNHKSLSDMCNSS
jgi:hypothetical protein